MANKWGKWGTCGCGKSVIYSPEKHWDKPYVCTRCNKRFDYDEMCVLNNMHSTRPNGRYEVQIKRMLEGTNNGKRRR